ncbi:DNA polymerase III subunit gamma/tau [Altericroceibacterium endophyticum]|uniref:DNA polymerase III subunit gamma/tau n=1 Tax=Altericroceibacterium endophyticum TaxID=1808508 RepID=A0A6I4T2G4_9SPHN|nr:DNA polymerase III subunit gamma/tau [Altericroceibacterium endophyticum]MXO64329.1 DNA polymerase III subunit gamma/tau [Altericroceibacterium endophyticum]
MDDSGNTPGDQPPWEIDRDGETPEQRPSATELEEAGQSALFGGGDMPAAPDAGNSVSEPAPAPAPTMQAAASDAPVAAQPQMDGAAQNVAPAQPYRVLARKYRPQTFSELIGQEPMVRTLANAIERDRLAHAFLMTGVRGVGKTSTARLIAKALNCVGPDGQGGPTIDPCGVCEPCRAIAEGRHIDVIEMDAASHTGVDDVREIIEAVRYSAVSARYKIYIIDEVHMLSRNAFNALLKTLEEPPAHVKFLFATTEVDKLPVTVLSRTQRFDLRRIPTPMLRDHFASICRREEVEAEEEALNMVAVAAEGSVRDGLSILDQAIAHADLDAEQGEHGMVTADRVRDMLGLADKGAQRRLFAALLEAQPKPLLEDIARQYSLGVEPLALMRGIMDLTHKITVAQIAGSAENAPTLEEREAVEQWAEKLSAGQLHRLWQLLLKGHEEVRAAPDPLVSLQMALLRVLHASDMPDPGQLVKKLEEMAAQGISAAAATPGDGANGNSAVQMTPPAPRMDWQTLLDQVEQSGELRAWQTMRDWVRVIELTPERLIYSLTPGFPDDPTTLIRDALTRATGERWHVEKGEVEGQPSLREVQETAKAEEQHRIRHSPLVEAAFKAFPDAEMIDNDEAVTGPGNWSKRA